jgi:hypothetical protein
MKNPVNQPGSFCFSVSWSSHIRQKMTYQALGTVRVSLVLVT